MAQRAHRDCQICQTQTRPLERYLELGSEDVLNADHELLRLGGAEQVAVPLPHPRCQPLASHAAQPCRHTILGLSLSRPRAQTGRCWGYLEEDPVANDIGPAILEGAVAAAAVRRAPAEEALRLGDPEVRCQPLDHLLVVVALQLPR
eukprot:3847392-Rhodomonas_salina.1